MPNVPRGLTLPAGALHALRAAALDTSGGAARLREAGEVAGLALYDDFAARVRASHGVEPEALSLARFVDELTAHLRDGGWGTTRVETESSALRLTADDWVEAEPDADADAPACHFSAGLLAGIFSRVAGAALDVREHTCRSAGAARCEFVVGSRATVNK